jgi:hypothetical protein
MPGLELPNGRIPDPGDIGDNAERPTENIHRWAKRVLRQAWLDVIGTDPDAHATELQAIQAVGLHESLYGWPSQAHWQGHHNWGAITTRCPDGFPSGDGAYVDGKWVPYQTCFKSFPTNLQGARHLILICFARNALLRKGDAGTCGQIFRWARAMREANYFCRTMGRLPNGQKSCSAATPAQKDGDALVYAKALDKGIKTICDATGDAKLWVLPSETRLGSPWPIVFLLGAAPLAYLLWMHR